MTEELYHGIMEKSSYHSLYCYIHFLRNTFKYWNIITSAQIESYINDAQIGFKGILSGRKLMIESKRGGWQTPATGALAAEEVEKHTALYGEIIKFLNAVLTADDSLYDSTFRS